MCSIIASFDKAKLLELYELNKHRGDLSHSMAAFDDEGTMQSLYREKGPMDDGFTISLLPEDCYYVGHTQAPTSNAAFVHPAIWPVLDGEPFDWGGHRAALWHNGIVKQGGLSPDTWDTQWLLRGLMDTGFSFLSSVTGSFACVMYRPDGLFVFRNEIAPLFVEPESMSISSTKFPNSQALPPNIVFAVELGLGIFTAVAQFETKENPYYMGDPG